MVDDSSPDDATAVADRRTPLWVRIAGFVGSLAIIAGLVLVVVGRDRDRNERSGTTGVTARTVALPPDNGGSITTTTPVSTPAGEGPTTLPRTPRTNDEVAGQLERALRSNTGFVHKVSCLPQGDLQRGEVLECFAATEPVIKEAPPSTVLAVVVDDQGHIVWTQAPGNDNTLEQLRTDRNLSCDDLAAQNRPWAYVLAYWLANDRPAGLDPGGTGRPCDGRYSSADIDHTLASAI